ncbi:MAG TPA: Clp protease N-terminal domain-containing protein [Streptosporangiaceae bacterium]
MFERFSDRARRVVVLAQEEARDLGHGYIGSEHLLLGLLHDEDGTACRVLRRLQVTPDAVREKVGAHIRPGGTTKQGHVPFTRPAKKALEMSLREALQLGHDYIGSGHLLLGLLREEHGTAARVLAELGVGLGRVRSLVSELGEPAEAQPGPRAFAAGPFRELPDRLKGIEERLAAIESRLAAIEERLEPPATPRSL